MNYNHADEWFNPSEGWQFVGDVAGGIGTSLPAIAGVAAGAAIAYFSGGTLTPVAASLIAGSIAGLGAAGRATKEAYDQTGELGGKEFGYGALVGVTEGAIEGVSSAIGAGTGAVVKSISKSFGKEVAKSATRNTLLKGVVKGFAGEAFEEGVQAILEPVYKRMTYDPNAKNATFQEVAYAALVGGLSGAIMGGGEVAVRNIRGTTRGNTLVNEGKSGDVITTAEQISSYQTENQTDYETFQVVQNTLDELKTSLQKTDGEVRTVRQKMLLGVLEQANTSAAFEPIVTASAENIYNNAETVAARLNELGYQDQNGKPIQVTAEQIREGIDTTDAKKFRKTMSRALKTNSVLRTLAVADTVGQISMDTARFRDATLAGQQLSTQADLNRFVEQATDAERQAVADRLGIENWETLTNEQFHDKITEFVANGGVQEYQQERSYVKEAQAVAPEAARKHLPRMVNLRNDGTYRYTQGGTDIAITKRGDSYYVYDYESGLMSKALSRTETNRVLREIHTNEQNYQNGVRQHTEAQNRLREQAAEIDTYARENISEYKNLSAAGQAAIRATIRQGRAAGVQEDFVLSCARVSARSGLRVVFSKEASFVAANGTYADGAIDLKNNRIIINPEAKSRSGESILIHELTHAIYNDTDGSLTVADGLETMTDAEKEKIRKRYAAVGQGSALQVSDEINAHFAEQTLSNKNILERLVQKKQTLKEKILGFFKKARTDYQNDEKLTGAAARLYRQYKKLFEEFSARNQRYLGVENASEQAGTTQMQQALPESLETLETYTADEIASIEKTSFYKVARSYAEVRDFIANAARVEGEQRLFLGKINAETAAKIKEATGISAEGKSIALSSSDIRHILNGHGNAATESPMGQVAVTQENFEDIIETIISPDTITRSDEGNQVGIMFTKEIDGRVTAITIVSEKKKALTLKSAWITKKKQSTSPTPDVQAPSLTSETGRRIKTTSTSSISQNAENVNPSERKGKKYALPNTDSDGNALSDEQRAYFSTSKITDAEGRLLSLYHGSNAYDEIHVFRRGKNGYLGGGIYLTDSESYARKYADKNGYKGRIYNVYADAKNPLEVSTNTPAKEILRAIYGSDRVYDRRSAAQSYETQLITSADIRKLRDKGFDAIVWRFGGSTEVSVFEANQIKLTSNKAPTAGNDVRYALSIDGETVSGAVEETRNLVALHNLSEDNLLRVIDLGGFPMPSIAVTTTELPHENYGNITVVFGRETIDPESDSRNVVYDRDAWTPTTPIVDVKLNNQRVDDLITDLQKETEGQPAFKSSIENFFDGKYRDNNGDYIVRDYDYTREAFGERGLQNSGIMAAYLGEKGISVEPVYAEKGFLLGWESYTRGEAASILDYVGITKDITRDTATEAQRQSILEKFIDYKARKNLHLLRRFSKNKNLTLEEVKENLRSEYDDGNVSQLFFMAEDFFNERRPKDIYDENATVDKMREKISDKQDFYDWLWAKIESVYEKRGIDNDSEIFDSRGNRRSFEQRHFSYTAANIVKAMSKGAQEGKANLGMTAGALAARLSTRFESIDDIRDAKEYLALVSEEDLKAFNDRTYELYDELVTAIAGKSSDFMSDSTRRDDVGQILAECAAAKPLNIENIKRIFARETRGYKLGYKFDDSIAEQAMLLFESLKHVPTTYFEAKPRRVVKLPEIKYVLVPENASAKLIEALKKNKISYRQYGAGSNARAKVLTQLDGVRFALPETDSAGESLSAEQREYFNGSKVVDNKGRLLATYHGSPNSFFTFDRGRMGKGNDQFGAGFYFATSEEASRSYGDNVHKTYLNITKPIVINRTADGGDLFDVKITQKQAYEILKRHPLIYDPESSPLGDMFEEYWEVGAKDYMIREAAKNFNSIGLLDSDYLAYRDYPNELHEAIRDVLGYDGVEVRFDNTGDRFYVAWFENQIKLTTNKQPTRDADIRFALSDSVVNVDSANETAAWTSERVTDLIDRYGATNPRYTQAYATWINPADFVKATTVNQTRRNQIYDEAGNLDIDALSRETQTPYLTVDYETMRIVGHEGRHRMAALAKAGVKRVAVAIRFTENSLSRYDARIMDGEHKLKGQTFSSWDADAQRVRTRTSHNSAAVGTLVPINAAYSAQLSEFTDAYRQQVASQDIEPMRGIRYALPNKQTLDFLEKQKTITVYRAMQLIDGELYPPMAARVRSADGKKQLVQASKIGVWEQADERPELIRQGNKFELDKANGSSIQAAYNPYFHTSRSPLNDQFSSAYKRDNLVIVEGEVPESELTSGYRAQYAKDSVGEMKWHSGPVSSKLPKGKERRVILSRWFKPVRVVPDSEVADVIADMLRGENISIPQNVVTTTLQKELRKRGVKIDNDNVRFALDGSEDGNAQPRGNYSVGQRARFAANNTGMRVYTKAEAAEVINSIIEERLVFEEIGMQGELRGKDRQAVIDYLFQKLNTVKEGYRGGVALKIADFMIEHTVLTDMYADSNGEVSEAMRRLSVLRRYMHKIDLRHIQGEIQYRFDRKNSINLVWGAKEGGIAPDTLPQLLADEGIFIDAVNEADCFLQMVEMYEDARAAVNNATESVMLSTYGDARTIKNLRQQIARDVLNAYEQKGRKSKYAKLVEKYTKQIAELKQRLRESNANNRLINSIVDQAQKMRDLKLGTFQNATQYDTEIFRSSIEKLGKIKFRGNFNIAGTRKIMADLRTWYTKDNPLLADSYEQGIADMLDEVANGKTNNYTKRELQSIRNIMAYFTNYVEHFNKVYRQGRWVDAVPEATRYIDILHRNEELKSSWFMRKVGTSYLQTFGDPMSVMRRMDRYESGFYTEIFTELRDSKIDAEIAKMQLMEEYEAFLKKNKKYLAQATKETVQYRGVEIPRMQLISLYMTLKRQHAQAGLAENGFGFWNAQDQRVRVDGFAKGITEESELRAAAVDEQARIAELLTETDKEYIAILEKGYQEAGRLKAERDIQRLGFTNATEDYYYPIRRGNIAKNVDSAEMQQELDRISNSSFNKDTVRGAKQELFIESADVVFNRHVRGVVQYAYISPAIETYNKLYNLDIAGTPNKPVSVSTESANVWKQGNDYFKKLITDIQGISPVSSEGRAVLSFIRGSYAKFQLGANPKVWVTQLSSLFASSSLLDASSITRGMTVSAKDVDTYCPLAKLRAQDNTAAMAQGVLDKVGRISNVLMAPIGKMDRFVVRRLFGACQVQVQKDGRAKIGTEANKIEAGKLLKRVILETQQNSLATERSAAMRSGNEIMRTITMFSADSMKVIGRVIDSVGELSALRARLRTTTDAESRATLQTQIKAARRKVRKSLTALATSALFMAAIAQLFSWLYNKDKDDDETAAQQVLVDFAGNLLGGLPLVRDIYSRIVEGYSVDNYAYSALNDLLDSAVNLFDTVGSLVSGDESNSKLTARTKNLLYSLGQLTGIPTRNIYNVFYGLTKRISPTTAYKIDEWFYAKNYVTDLNKAIESDDTDMIAMLTSMIFGERMGNTTMSDAVRNKFVDLYSKGYSVLPRSIGDTITYGGVEIPLTEQEYSRFRSIYAQSMKDLEKMINSGTFSVLSEEMQAKAIKQVYDAYYYDALSDLVGVDERTTVGELSKWIDMSKLSVAFVGLSDIESEKNSKGETIAGSKKKNTVKYLLKQNLSDGERLLILCYRGYTIQDGDYRGYTAKRAKRILLQYILKLKGTQAEKAVLAEKCGFTVRNGRIIRDF